MKKVLQNIVISIFSNFYTLFGSYIKKGKGAASLKKVKNKLSFIGSGVRFNGTVTITAPGSTAIGNNVHVGDNAFLRTEGGLEIGDNTHISRNITIYTQNHQYQGAVLPFDKDSIKKPVVIGKNVWIGMNVSILPGVTIGDGAIIGLGTVVIKDIEPLSIVGHPSPNFIKSRDGDHYNRLENDKAYGAVGGKKLSKEAIANYKAWPNGK